MASPAALAHNVVYDTIAPALLPLTCAAYLDCDNYVDQLCAKGEMEASSSSPT
jgi:hypothetical protein